MTLMKTLVVALAFITLTSATVAQTKPRPAGRRPSRAAARQTTALRWTQEQKDGLTYFINQAKRVEAIYNGGLPRDPELYVKESKSFINITITTAAMFPKGGAVSEVIKETGGLYWVAAHGYQLMHPSDVDEAFRRFDKTMRDKAEEEVIEFMREFERFNPNNGPLSVLQWRIFLKAVEGRKLLELDLIKRQAMGW
jgi:hypothetical protein